MLWIGNNYMKFFYQHSIKYYKILNIEKMLKETFIVLMVTTLHAQYTLSLDFPLLLDNQYTNITSVKWDKQDGYNVAFQNKQFRHYSSDFSNFTSFTLSYVAQQICTWWYQFTDEILSNGTSWNMKSSMNIGFSNHRKTLKVHNYTTMAEIQSYNFNETILYYQGFPIQFSSTFIPHHTLIANQTIKIIYKGEISTALNFSQIYNSGTICTSALFSSGYQGSGVDYYYFTYHFVVALSTKEVVNLTVLLNFTMNYTSGTFDLAYSLNRISIFTPSDTINSIFATNSLILMQSNSTGTMYIYNSATHAMGTVDSSIPKQQIFSFVYKFNHYYLLQSNGLTQINYSKSSNTLSFVNLTSSLPLNNYRIASGTYFDVLYVPNTPYIYKAGYCMNQSQFDGTNTCVEYSCTTLYCSSCSFSSSICSICNSGFTRDQQYKCSNSTTTENSTNTNSSHLNQTNSSKNLILIDSYDSSLFFFLNQKWMRNLLDFSTDTIKMAISVPAARKIVTPLFYYFSNFDDLFLYSLHNREYSDVINILFQQIANIEDKKWTLISFQRLCEYSQINSSKILSFLEFQQNYMQFSIIKKGPISLGIFVNCANFLFVEVVIISLGFIILKRVFRTFNKFSLSQLFRRFDFWIYFFILIFEGNIQQFSFYLTAELKAIFAFQWANKFVKVFIIYFAHCLFLFSFCGYFVGIIFYKKLNRFFTDNNKNNLEGNFFLILQNGIRNLVLGAIHFLFRNKIYQYLIGALIMVEVIFFIIFLVGISYKVYVENTKMWIYQIFTLNRILLIFTFSVDRRSINQIVFDQIEKILIFMMVSLSILSFLFFVQDLIKGIKGYLSLCFCSSKLLSNERHKSIIINSPPRLNRNDQHNQRISLVKDKTKENQAKTFIMKIRGASIFLKKQSQK